MIIEAEQSNKSLSLSRKIKNEMDLMDKWNLLWQNINMLFSR